MPLSLSAVLVSGLFVSATPTSTLPPELSPHVAEALVGAALTDGLTWERLEELTDRVGPRLSGSPGAAKAVAWALARFAAEGVQAHAEPAKVPHWVRGVETGELVTSDGSHPMALTALGGSPPTPKEGITAEVVEVRSLEEVAALGTRAKGKVLFFNHPMAVSKDYGTYGKLRAHGPDAAARAGAVAAVVRSLATASQRSPHTGQTSFEPGTRPVPAAALSLEDADALHRALLRGPARVHLTLGCATLPDVASSNVVAEVRGASEPQKVVLLGAHLDSWDLATGAEDDGAGVAMVMEVARLLAHLQTPPARTVRVVLFMNEENGLQGGRAYAKQHAQELADHVAALEADSGGGRPLGVAVSGGPGAEELLVSWLEPLAPLGWNRAIAGEAGGADLIPLEGAHVPLVGVQQDGTHYFDFHHSAADTLDKLDPQSLAQSAAALTWVTYALAQAPAVLPRPSSAKAP